MCCTVGLKCIIKHWLSCYNLAFWVCVLTLAFCACSDMRFRVHVQCNGLEDHRGNREIVSIDTINCPYTNMFTKFCLCVMGKLPSTSFTRSVRKAFIKEKCLITSLSHRMTNKGGRWCLLVHHFHFINPVNIIYSLTCIIHHFYLIYCINVMLFTTFVWTEYLEDVPRSLFQLVYRLSQ